MGGSSTPTTTQTAKTVISPEQQKIMDLAFPMAQQYAATPIQQYAGTGIAPFSGNELQAQQNAVSAANGPVSSLAGQAAGAQSQMLDPNFQLNVADNPYVQGAADAVVSKTTDNLMRNILPQVRSGATQAGGMYSGASSREANLEGQAIGDTGTGISRALADMYLSNYNSGRGSLQNAISTNPNVMGQQIVAPEILAGVGGQERAMQQAIRDEEIRKFYATQGAPLQQASDLMSLLKGMPGAETQVQSTGAVPQGNPFTGTLGGAASGAAIGRVVPVVGAPAGAGLGALLGYLGSRR